MRDVPFQTGGPLPSNSPVYIERKTDREALHHLHRMHYLQLTEPRQQGKTSLIYRLRSKLSNSGYVFAYVDAEGLKPNNYPDWYVALTRRLTTQLESTSELHSHLSDEHSLHSFEWRDCLAHLARAGQRESKKLVIALDEIGSVPTEWAESFFRVLREAYVVREVEPYFKHITFILAGAFDPRDLIADSKISPFNVAQRIHLEDFTLDQVEQLVAHLGLPEFQASEVSERLAYWTDGQPYLVQKICSYLAESGDAVDANAVDAAVERFFREDTNHLPRISKDLEADAELLSYAHGVIAGNVKFSPAVNPAHFQLAHVIGVINPDEDGRCRIRNRVYERALAEIGVGHSPEPARAPQGEFRYDVFISYSHRDSAWVRGTLLPCLEGKGLRVCIDFRDFEPGVASLVNMENAVEHSRKTLIVLTPAWVESEWTAFESLLIQTDDPAGRRARMIPLRLKPCEPPRRIAMLTDLDLTKASEVEFQLRRLVLAIRSEWVTDIPQPVRAPEAGILTRLKEEMELNWALLNNPPLPSSHHYHPEYYDPTRQVFKYRDDAIVSALSQVESGIHLDTELAEALLAASHSIRFVNQQIDELMAFRFSSADRLAEASNLVRKNPSLLQKFAAAPDKIKPKRLRSYLKELALRHWAIVNEGYWKRLKPSLEALRQPLNQALQQAGLGLLNIPGAVDVDRVSTLFSVIRVGSASDFGDSDFKENEQDDKW